MTKKEFIDKYSKVSETFEDEFRSQYNSPELMWESLKDILITKKSTIQKDLCCPQCGNERLESTGGKWYICADRACDWGGKL